MAMISSHSGKLRNLNVTFLFLPPTQVPEGEGSGGGEAAATRPPTAYWEAMNAGGEDGQREDREGKEMGKEKNSNDGDFRGKAKRRAEDGFKRKKKKRKRTREFCWRKKKSRGDDFTESTQRQMIV